MCKFYADSMLGKLSRYLRFLGFDTLYRTDESIDEMLQISVDDNRNVLSRSQEVFQLCIKGEIITLLLTNIDISGQLREIKDTFSVDFVYPPLEMRCSVCNGDLKKKTKLDILNRIPEGTAKEYDDFWECSKCFKIYWVGSHWEDIKKTISELQ